MVSICPVFTSIASVYSNSFCTRCSVSTLIFVSYEEKNWSVFPLNFLSTGTISSLGSPAPSSQIYSTSCPKVLSARVINLETTSNI